MTSAPAAAADADVDAVIARERALSPSLGGRTVFDDAPRVVRDRPTRRRGQLSLLDE